MTSHTVESYPYKSNRKRFRNSGVDTTREKESVFVDIGWDFR